MFEKLITQVLNKVLGDFIENIDPAQLNISVLNGNVSLQNMKLKSTLFNSMPLPFQLEYGQIGTINLKIPVFNLMSQPLVIEIRDVFAIVRPKHIKEWNEEVEIKSYRSTNQSMLEQFELFTGSTESLVKKDPSSIDKMITKIIDNLEISIKNIYIRYEDSFSAPNNGQGKFVLGFMLKEFSTFTSGSDWKTKLMTQGEDITFKLAKLKNFTIFMDYEFEDQKQIMEQRGIQYLDDQEQQNLVEYKIDYEGLKNDKGNQIFMDILKNELERKDIKHTYIIDRFSMEARLQLNKNPKSNKKPQIDVNVLMGGQFKNIDSDEHEIAIKLQVYQPQIIRLLKLLEYIGYYNEFQKGALANFQSKNLSQDISNEYIKNYVEWKTIKDEKKSNKIAEEKRKLMTLIEDEYPSSKMIVLRKFANKVLSQKEEEKKEQNEIEQKVKEMSSKTKGWGLFTSKEKKAQQQKEIDDYREQLQGNFQKKLEQDQNEFEIPAVKFQFFNEFEQAILEAVIQQQVILVDLGKGVTTVLYQVLAFRVDDRWTDARSFPSIIETKEINNQGQVLESQDQTVQQSQSLIFSLQSNEPGSISPFKIVIKSEKTLFIVANFHFIKEIKRSVLAALQGETLDFSFFQEAATERAIQYMYAGKEFLEAVKKGEFKHQAVDISVSLTAPIILVPEDIFNQNKPCLVIDTGSITLNSQLVRHDSSVDYKSVQDPTNLYDKYEINLSNFQINILENGLTEGLGSFNRGQGSQIIQKFDSKITLFNCLEPMHPQFPTAELSVLVSNFEVELGLSFVKSIMNIQTGIMEQFDTKEEQIIGQASQSKEYKEISKLSEIEYLTQLRKKAKEQAKAPQGDIDDMYGDILEELDPEKYNKLQELERKYSYKAPIQDAAVISLENGQEAQKTNFKVYVAIEKLQITLQDSISENQHDGIMNILILHFGVEAEIDRKMNTHVNLSLYKFLIEDTQQDASIALPFRMILSSPINEQMRGSQATEVKDKYYDALNFEASVMARSLLAQMSKNYDADEEFKDACSSEENLIINVWELKLNIEKKQIHVDCQISDLRFIFAVPTARKLIHIGIKLKDIFEDIEVKQQESRRRRLLMFEDALNNIDKLSQLSDENLIKKIFKNYSKAAGVDQAVGKVLYKESIQRLYNLYDIEQKAENENGQDLKIDNKINQTNQDNSSRLLKHLKNKFEQLYEKTEDVKTSLQVKAVLRNFTVWVPLNAEIDNSQVLSLSCLSDLVFIQDTLSRNTYEVTLNELIKKHPLESQDQLAFSIKHFMVEMIKTENYFELFNIPRLSNGFYPKDKYQSSVLINPCRLALQMNNSNKEKELFSKSDINLTLEPLEIQVGFTHVDFANMIMIQLDKTLKFVKQITQESDARNKEFKQKQKEKNQNVQKVANKRSSHIEIEDETFKLQPYRKDQKSKAKITNIKIELESLQISLNDDSGQVDQPLVQIKIQSTNIGLKMFEKEDDAATFLLKKMGIFQMRNPDRSQEEHFMIIDAFTMINGKYFNQRSLAFEPLLENYYLIAQVKQQTPYSQQVIRVQSEKMLNINLTFGMALTIRKIKDRVMESFQGAQVMKKLESDEKITQDEAYLAKEWERKMTRQNLRDEQSQQFNQNAGFIFENHTGLPLRAELHDSMKTDLIKLKSDDPYAVGTIQKSEIFSQVKQFNLSEDHANNSSSIFINYEELYQQQKQITLRKHKGQFIESIEEDPLKMDFDINGLLKLEGIPIETLGVHSYRVGFMDQQLAFYKPKDSMFGKKEAPTEASIGVICNIKMDGQIKKVSLESQVLIMNNLNRPVQVYVQQQGSNSYPKDNERVLILPEQVFRVPLHWLFSTKQYQLFIEGKAMNQLVIKNMHEAFTDQAQDSKLTSNNSSVVRLEHDFYTTVDIQSFTCLPLAAQNNPPQYLLSFNPPVMISNYNFQSLEIRDLSNNQNDVIALMAPKESAYLNCIDGYHSRPHLQWIYHEDLDSQISLITKDFNIPDRLNEQQVFEKFVNNPKFRRDLRTIKLIFEMRKNHFLDIQAYNENFELRQKSLHNFTSSVQLMIYSKYMMINKNSMLVKSERQYIEPFTNEYFNHSKNKVQFQVPGFKSSQSVDITTVGLSGAISLDFDNRDDVKRDQLPQENYIPQKLELGVVIQTAPSPFNKTTLISVVPRFLIINQLGHPVVIKQRGCSSQVLMINQQMPYNFEKNLNRQIMIRQPPNMELKQFSIQKRLFQDQADDELQFWSQPFSIDDVEDFQISYPGQDIQEHHYDDWYMPKPENYYQRFVRVLVTTQNEASILIVLTNPVYPEYEIVNKTGEDIAFAQMQEASILNGLAQLKKHLNPDEMIVGKFHKIKNKITVPYVWQDRTLPNRLLAIKIGNSLKEINIDQGMQKLIFSASNQMRYNVEINVSGNAKKIKISSINDEKESFKKAIYLQNLLKRQTLSSLSINLDLRGIGLSFIDEKPVELLFLSLFGINIDLHRWAESRSDGSGILETMTRITLHLNHLQIDNMVNDIMPVILAPSRSLAKAEAKQKKDKKFEEESKESQLKQKQTQNNNNDLIVPAKEEEIPFLQVIITVAESQDKKSNMKQRRLRAFQVQLQEFMFQIETSILNSNLKFIVELVETFSDKSAYKLIMANAQSFEKAKYFKREEICAIKAIITFKVERKAFELDVFDPQRGFGVLNLFYTVFANVANISNSPLSFNELIMTDMFVSEDILVNQVGKNYARQAVMQFYKLIGSSDIIGNPVGLVNKLGTGVFEFVSEPAKGLLKGPDEFVGGVGKGVQSLVSNVISGGFESVSKITGSLYNVVKNVGGENRTEIKQADHIADGLYQGVKGGVSELVGGFTGIFTKPIEKTRQEGAKGFFKGMGQGLFGAITAPVTATLRAGTSITQGVASSATSLGNIGKTQQNLDTSSVYARFRPPRYITARNIITEFDEELAQVALIVNDMFKGKYTNQSIKYFCYLPETKSNGEILNINPHASLVIITENKFLYLKPDKEAGKKAKPQLLFKISLRKILNCEVYQSPTSNIRTEPTYLLQVTCYTPVRGKFLYKFVCLGDYFKLEKIYNLVSILPQCEGEDKVKGTKSTTNKILEQCF
eukprot:403350423